MDVGGEIRRGQRRAGVVIVICAPDSKGPLPHVIICAPESKGPPEMYTNLAMAAAIQTVWHCCSACLTWSVSSQHDGMHCSSTREGVWRIRHTQRYRRCTVCTSAPLGLVRNREAFIRGGGLRGAGEKAIPCGFQDGC